MYSIIKMCISITIYYRDIQNTTVKEKGGWVGGGEGIAVSSDCTENCINVHFLLFLLLLVQDGYL